MNIIDKLIENTVRTKNPTVVGLDPDLGKIPKVYKEGIGAFEDPLEQVAAVIFEFNKDIIDTLCDIIPAVKPQIAFYEMYGAHGFAAFQRTVTYAKARGLIVIGDGKRNDIGNTAAGYAKGFLGRVEVLDKTNVTSVDVDFLTVSPFLGSDSIEPFIHECVQNNKGIFVLVKTSNKGSGEIQDIRNEFGFTVSEMLAKYLDRNSQLSIGVHHYSPIGAVVGATYPDEAEKLRKLMPKNYLLVPGYGSQGAGARDVLPCFHEDGLGAIVNSSRGILYSHMTDDERNTATKQEFLNSVKTAAKDMQKEIYDVLKNSCSKMEY